MQTEKLKHRGEVLLAYVEAGLTPVEAIQKLKTENKEFSPAHRDASGAPLTFEAAVFDQILKGNTPDRALRAVNSRYPKMQGDYYRRLKIGAAADLERIIGSAANLERILEGQRL